MMISEDDLYRIVLEKREEFIQRMGKEPNNVYLGYKEMSILGMLITFDISKGEDDNVVMKLMGMKLLKVVASSHIGIGI